MNKAIEFVIFGEPKGKDRPRFKKLRNFVTTYSTKQTKSYESLVKLIASQQLPKGHIPLENALKVEISSYFAIPESFSKKKRQQALSGVILPTKKPDTDNIAKIILDSLNGIVYRDDKQVVELQVVKKYSDTPMTYVKIQEILGDVER